MNYFIWLGTSLSTFISLELDKNVTYLVQTPLEGKPAKIIKNNCICLTNLNITKNTSYNILCDIYKELELNKTYTISCFSENNIIDIWVILSFFLKGLLSKEKLKTNDTIYISLKDYLSKEVYNKASAAGTNLRLNTFIIPESLSAVLYLVEFYKRNTFTVINFRGTQITKTKYNIIYPDKKEKNEEKKIDKIKIQLIDRIYFKNGISDIDVENAITDAIKKAIISRIKDNIIFFPDNNIVDPQDTPWCNISNFKERVIINLNFGFSTYEHLGIDIYRKNEKIQTIPSIKIDLNELKASLSKECMIEMNSDEFYISSYNDILKYNNIYYKLIKVDYKAIYSGNLNFTNFIVDDPLVTHKQYNISSGTFVIINNKLELIDQTVKLADDIDKELLKFNYIDKTNSLYQDFITFHHQYKHILSEKYDIAHDYLQRYKAVENQELDIKGKFILHESNLKMLIKTIDTARELGLDVNEDENFLATIKNDVQAAELIRNKIKEIKIKIMRKKIENEKALIKENNKENKMTDTNSNVSDKPLEKTKQIFEKLQHNLENKKNKFNNLEVESVDSIEKEKVDKLFEQAIKEEKEANQQNGSNKNKEIL